MKAKKNTVYIEWIGCDRRMLELTTLRDYFIKNKYKIVGVPNKAELILLGTCAFKKKEEDSAISRIKNLQKYNARIIVYGCLPDIAPARFKNFTNIEYVSPKNIEKIDSIIKNKKFKYNDIPLSNISGYYHSKYFILNSISKLFNKNILTREFYGKNSNKLITIPLNFFKKTNSSCRLFICKGCEGKCSYCAIKFAIGQTNSRSIEAIIDEFKTGIKSGYKNYIILGDDPGSYGIDIDSSFPILLNALIDQEKKLNFRNANFCINEIHPKWLIRYKDELKDSFKTDRIAEILCPVQSGSNRILNLMTREHTIDEIKEVFYYIKNKNPKIKISTQIMVGFPSETEEDFKRTLEFLIEMKFAYTVVFPYHEKKLTKAAKLPGKVPDSQIQKRFMEAQKVLRKNKLTVYTSCPT
jgi:tRNA A37 methylthiotransferase MiaB